MAVSRNRPGPTEQQIEGAADEIVDEFEDVVSAIEDGELNMEQLGDAHSALDKARSVLDAAEEHRVDSCLF